MAVVNRTNLKDKFQKGDKPSQDDFRDLIDSFLHLNDNADTTLKLSSISASAGGLNINTASIGHIIGNLVVSGNIVPVPDAGTFTSSFSLGSEKAAWRDLFVSEDSVKFVRKGIDGEPQILASIKIDKDSGNDAILGDADVIKLKDPTGDHMDLETRQIQIGQNRQQGLSFNDGKGHSSTDVYGKYQSYVGQGKGQQLLFRPEYHEFLPFGRKAKAHSWNAQGAGSTSFLLQNQDADKNGFFRIEKDTSIAGFGTPLFEVHEGKKHTFYGKDSKVTVEGTIETTGATLTGGNTIIENAVTTQPGTISQSLTVGTPNVPATLEMVGVGNDKSIRISANVYRQVTEITFNFNGLRTSSLQDVNLAASGAFYFATQNGTFHTFTFNTPELGIATSQISGSVSQATLTGTVLSNNVTSGSSGISTGEQLALTMGHTIDSTTGFSTIREVNKIIITHDDPGDTINASTSFLSTTASISTTTQGGGAEVRIGEGSTFRIIPQQPTIIADSTTGTITLSDPDIDGGGDITINPDNGGNPTIIFQNTTIPANQVSYWTVGSNIQGTFISAGGPQLGGDTGIQIGGNMGAAYDGIFINGVEISPAFSDVQSFNIRLRIEEGAKLYIQPETQVTPTDDGTLITGTTLLDVTNTNSSVDITGVDGSDTLNVQGGNAYYDVSQMSMDITEGGFFGIGVSGSTYAQNLANINMLLTVEGGVVEQYSSDIVITSSIVLSQQKHGNGRLLHVYSGSGLTLQEANPENTYSTVQGQYPSEAYNFSGKLQSIDGGGTSGSWGVLDISLPAAVIGASFHIRNAVPTSAGFGGVHTCSVHDVTNQNTSIPEFALSFPYPLGMGSPSIKISPSGSNKFHFGATGAPGVAGKAVTFTSQSMHGGNFIKLYCISQSHWMIQEVGGDLVDEA